MPRYPTVMCGIWGGRGGGGGAMWGGVRLEGAMCEEVRV